MNIWIYIIYQVRNVYHGFKVSQGLQVFHGCHLWIYGYDVWIYEYMDISIYGYFDIWIYECIYIYNENSYIVFIIYIGMQEGRWLL